MISIKTKEEILIMREGGCILALVFEELADSLKPGVRHNELDKRAKKFIENMNGIISLEQSEEYKGSVFTFSLPIAT